MHRSYHRSARHRENREDRADGGRSRANSRDNFVRCSRTLAIRGYVNHTINSGYTRVQRERGKKRKMLLYNASSLSVKRNASLNDRLCTVREINRTLGSIFAADDQLTLPRRRTTF